MKLKSLLKRIAATPPVVIVVGVASLVALGIVVAKSSGIAEVDPLVATVGIDRAGRERSRRPAAQGVGFGAPMVKTAARLEQAHALVAILALERVYLQVSGGGVPARIEGLLASAEARGTLPPGIELDGYSGVAHGADSKLFIRYRPDPVGIEVVSVGVGKPGETGAPLLVRITAEEGAAAFSCLREREPIPVPAAFATKSEVVAAEWNEERLREAPQ